MNRLRLGLVSAGFLGCAPVAPGTFGTLGGVAIAALLRPSGDYLLWTLVACAVVYAVGRALAPWAEARGGKDPGFFVLDEVLGYLVTVAWTRPPSLLALGVGFAAFRFFDILKPWPVRSMERIPGGDGILLDDLVAGLYGLAVMILARTLFPGAEHDLWTWSDPA